MKAKNILTILFVCLIFAPKMFAQDVETVRHVSNTDYGKLIETTYFYIGTKTISKHTKTKVNQMGNYTETIVYDWDVKNGWQKVDKLEYLYVDNHVLESIVRSKWDMRKMCWQESKNTLHYVPHKNGGYELVTQR